MEVKATVSVIYKRRDDLTIHLPTQALTECNATVEGKVYLAIHNMLTAL